MGDFTSDDVEHDEIVVKRDAWEQMRAENDRLKALVTRRSGASSWEEWNGKYDLTESSPLDIIEKIKREFVDEYAAGEGLQADLAALRAFAQVVLMKHLGHHRLSINDMAKAAGLLDDRGVATERLTG